MSEIVYVGYVGKKESQDDKHIAGTGFVWYLDEDTVHPVSAAQAAKLLVHTDSFERRPDPNPSKSKATNVDKTKETKSSEVKEDKPKEEPFAQVNFENMTKDAIAQYAKRSFNADVDTAKTKEAMITEVRALQEKNTPDESR